MSYADRLQDELELIYLNNFNLEFYAAFNKAKCVICGSREHQWKYGDKIHGKSNI